jgi:putative ABC transport system ATP-binding protein
MLLGGPSGSGKSTLLSILGCLLAPDEGTVRILGRDITGLDAQMRTMLRRHDIGFVFQGFHLLQGLTALDNVCVPMILQGIDEATSRARARQLLAQVGLADQCTAVPSRLSMGQCQRVALARALAGDPELILADEPTASLDARTGFAVVELLKRLANQHGKTVIVVTHDARIFPMADRVCFLEDGRLVEGLTHSGAHWIGGGG